jgi:hypothetical protein
MEMNKRLSKLNHQILGYIRGFGRAIKSQAGKTTRA